VTTENVRQLAHDRRSSFEIKQAAIKDGMLTLRDDAFRKAMEGTTSLEEVLRATKGDHLG
jgi:general secretion pathway protein E/type IV pilus assembly protein PilB